MKRTNIVLDEELVEEGMQLTGAPSYRALVHQALKDLVRRERQVKLLELKGKISWEGDLDQMRSTR